MFNLFGTDFSSCLYLKTWEIVLVILWDLLIGDPQTKYHPVSLIGYLISKTEKFFIILGKNTRKIDGFLFFLFVVWLSLFSFGMFFLVLRILGKTFLVAHLLFFFLISFFIAFKSLLEAGLRVEEALRRNDILTARKELQALVGRDRECLLPIQIRRAVLESYAENLSDGVIAPLFWLLLLGWPGLLFYKVVNTLDSMVGYKNVKYLHFGYVSAKMDDLLNYFPARITGILICLSALFFFGLSSGLRALKTMYRDGGKHESPNSGYVEAAMAGALGVALLGPSSYQGKITEKPWLGEENIKINPNLISASASLLKLSYFFWVILIVLLYPR